MSLAADSAAIIGPREEDSPDDSKSFRNLTGLLSTITRRDAAVDHEPSTVKKSALMMLTATLLHSSLGAARVLLVAIVDIIVAILEEIARAVDVVKALQCAITSLKSACGREALSLHPTTVNAIKPSMSRAEMEFKIEEQYSTNMTGMVARGAVSSFITLVFDYTGQTIRSIFGNGTFTQVKVGQKATWEAGFEYSGVYDATHKQFVGGMHHDNPYPDINKQSIHGFVEYVRAKIECVTRTGSTVAVMEGDRWYFNPGIFVCADLGKFTPSAPAEQGPRLVTPWKFGADKDSSKEKLVLRMPDSGVEQAYLPLDPAKYPWLASACEAAFTKNKAGSYLVPVARVVLVVNEDGKPEQSFKDFKIEYGEVLEAVLEADNRLQDAEEAYVIHRTNMTGKKCSTPSHGRGKKRSNFIDEIDDHLYHACFTLYDEVKALKARKAELIARLLVFAISLRPGEDPSTTPETFVALAKEYTIRWGIENGFKDIKHVFLRKIRSRKPTSRQFELMLAMMLYNDWQVERTLALMDEIESAGNAISLFSETEPSRRCTLEKESKNLITAVSFLIQIWERGVTSLLIEKIKNEVANS